MAAADIKPLITCLHEALRHLHAPDRLANTPLCASSLVEDYCKKHPTLTAPHALNNLLNEMLATLATEQPQYVDLLRGHFWEELTVDEMVARQRPEAQSARRFHQLQHNALAHLAQAWQEAELHLQEQNRRQQLLHELPVSSYDSLFGIELWAEQAFEWLNNPKAAPILTLKGNGGIGKTALADCIVRRGMEASDFYQQVVWISAKQEYLTPSAVQSLIKPIGRESSKVSLGQIFDKLAQMLGLHEICGQSLEQQIKRLAVLLRQQPHLIVIDNLESVSDFAQLTPLLARLVSPTRFILMWQRGLAIRQDWNEIEGIAVNSLYLAASELALDHWAEAERLLQRSLALFHELGNRLELAICHLYWGELERKRGNVSATCVHWRQALALMQTISTPVIEQSGWLHALPWLFFHGKWTLLRSVLWQLWRSIRQQRLSSQQILRLCWKKLQ